MPGFWDSSLGEVSGKPEDAFAKSFIKVPDGTMALAKIDSFVIGEYEGHKYLNIDWFLIEGEFRGAHVSQKLKVWGDTRDKDMEKGRHRALNMFKLLYQLYNIKPKHNGDPTDEDLSIFVGKTAGIKIRETEPDKETGNTYNWVSEVHAAQGFKCETGVKLEVVHTRDNLESAFQRNPKVTKDDEDEDIPF